jgi:DNA helicase HerA-like ATPase
LNKFDTMGRFFRTVAHRYIATEDEEPSLDPEEIIEEETPVASTKLVSEQLLPQGRSFGLSMGLVMQFPGQVRNRSERAYDEVLNNIKTKLVGNISIERDLAESLTHEDLSPTDLRNRNNTLPSGEWIAQLPSSSFGKTGAPPFSVKPLPIAAGHLESDEPLSVEQEDHFETVWSSHGFRGEHRPSMGLLRLPANRRQPKTRAGEIDRTTKVRHP